MMFCGMIIYHYILNYTICLLHNLCKAELIILPLGSAQEYTVINDYDRLRKEYRWLEMQLGSEELTANSRITLESVSRNHRLVQYYRASGL